MVRPAEVVRIQSSVRPLEVATVTVRAPSAPRTTVNRVSRVAPRPPAPPAALRTPARSSAQSQEARPSSSSRARSSRRWRSRNRYPGPIPTPAEWQPPEGPIRIGLQAGHWRADEAPRELSGLKGNGTSADGVYEWEVNLEIVRSAADQLRELGYEVDVLPAVVPPGYRAHLFLAVHADGSNDGRANGYRIAAPRQDATGRAQSFVRLLERSYGDETRLKLLPTVTRRMRSYYAFNYRRYEHALHPMTIAAIIETGFLTNAGDRRVIVQNPEQAARGIVEAVRSFPVTALTAEASGN